jgi:N-methylhydantoinase A
VFDDARIYDRARLTEADVVEGPAVIEQSNATIVVPPQFVARVGAYGAIFITRG